MLDKLCFGSPTELTFDEAAKRLEGQFSAVTQTATRYHTEVYAFQRGSSHLLTLHIKPRHFSITPTKVEMNPSRFESFEELSWVLDRLELKEREISRLDHSVDVKLPVERLHTSLIFSRKKSCRYYEEGHTLTGWYQGKYPERLLVYDKARQAKVTGPLTRIELQQHREKLPVRSFEDLPNLTSYRPFSRLRFVEVSKEDRTTSGVYLQRILMAHGAQVGFKKLNRHSNFNRNFSKTLTRPEEIPDLDELYGAEARAFFQGGTNVG